MGIEAAQGLFQCVLDGCLSSMDGEIRRRPYHKNCGCALHRSGGDGGSDHAHHCAAASKISYQLRRSNWDNHVSLSASSSSPSFQYFRDYQQILKRAAAAAAAS
ncbi:hypothetical protein J5N97_003183 [Dioscorea zingiberensis]|uniref:Uncharacterized protein n=1 Tax=Dioscorea zingiberensis TaxID=325984 RepID=A0A9D5HR24_9LILI|nr:hypothetical protein J5N97_003183 [Dioscorea zingiberensis]